MTDKRTAPLLVKLKDNWLTIVPVWLGLASVIALGIGVGVYKNRIDTCVDSIKSTQADVKQVQSDVNEVK